jgi:hypothetical protein
MLMFPQFGDRPHLYVLDDQHHVIGLPNDDRDSVLIWAAEMESARRIVEQTDVRRWFGTFWVSTVFLGLDHNFFFNGPPLVFETMVFQHGFGAVDFEGLDQQRYSTWDEAVQGHWTTVALARAHAMTFRAGLRMVWRRILASWEQHKRDLGLPIPTDDRLDHMAHNLYAEAAALDRRRTRR